MSNSKGCLEFGASVPSFVGQEGGKGTVETQVNCCENKRALRRMCGGCDDLVTSVWVWC